MMGCFFNLLSAFTKFNSVLGQIEKDKNSFGLNAKLLNSNNLACAIYNSAESTFEEVIGLLGLNAETNRILFPKLFRKCGSWY